MFKYDIAMRAQPISKIGWMVSAFVGWIFIAVRAWKAPPPLPIQIPERLVGEIDYSSNAGRDLRGVIARSSRAIWEDPRGSAQRRILGEILWRLYDERLVRYRHPDRGLLLNVVGVTDCFESSGPATDACLWSGLAEEELSRLSSDDTQRRRWLSLASDDAENYSKAIQELPNARQHMGDLEYLKGRILLRQYRSTRDSKNLERARRHFWSSVALAPLSARNRFYLSLSEHLAGNNASARRNASKILSLPNSATRNLVEGPSEIYRRWALELRSDRMVDVPY